jgi:hypothetical protein
MPRPKPDSLQGSLDPLVLKILARRPRLAGEESRWQALTAAVNRVLRTV